jgi:prephenate dehydrogenase
MRLAFLGLGLIGGSIARAVLAAGDNHTVRAWTPDGAGPAAAGTDGVTACATAEDAVRDADLVVLAAPPLACLDLLDDLAGRLAPVLPRDAVITDVASTKVAIGARADALDLRFVGGHPLAGRETSGYETADPDLFRDRPWVIVPGARGDGAAQDRVLAIVAACGARPQVMRAVDHDAAVAAISHAPLVLSAALVEAIARGADWPAARGLAAGGWASMTRLARGDARMGAGILATNGAATAERLTAVRAVLDEWIGLIEGSAAVPVGDADELRERLETARALAEGDR